MVQTAIDFCLDGFGRVHSKGRCVRPAFVAVKTSVTCVSDVEQSCVLSFEDLWVLHIRYTSFSEQ